MRLQPNVNNRQGLYTLTEQSHGDRVTSLLVCINARQDTLMEMTGCQEWGDPNRRIEVVPLGERRCRVLQQGDEIFLADFQPARPIGQGFLLQLVVGPNNLLSDKYVAISNIA
jgi:hypothetical protein